MYDKKTPNKSNESKKSKFEDEEQLLALKERELNLREQTAKVCSLELQNIQLENELNGTGGRVGN